MMRSAFVTPLLHFNNLSAQMGACLWADIGGRVHSDFRLMTGAGQKDVLLTNKQEHR
ncbi:hypothetical protein SAMN05216198_0846 [Halopseudomonas litoralis]|uniref:Uncharacterized protein n=1 Tax=Halopseudomonas litoralis TaxID=797277 RepID=A0A1H1N9B3_9GAMM|nr:hypothetical protein [Halopseudomonas litoralis]SDR95582.1 hypothetical protein SAMN05216198_0846 [Halopseudomonas litoralis]